MMDLWVWSLRNRFLRYCGFMGVQADVTRRIAEWCGVRYAQAVEAAQVQPYRQRVFSIRCESGEIQGISLPGKLNWQRVRAREARLHTQHCAPSRPPFRSTRGDAAS
jgi:hypothetical protein